MKQQSRASWAPAVAIVLAALAIVRIVSTYPILNQTADESAHISSGMEWLERGSYLYGPDHPPLPRIAAALGPYLSGIRLTDAQKEALSRREEEMLVRQNKGVTNDPWPNEQFVAGTELLEQGGKYFQSLSLARMGILSFILLSLGLTWVWSRLLFGEHVAVLAVFFLSTQPAFLGHAGLATTDAALACFVLAGLLAFGVWLDTPRLFWGAMVGVAWGMAAISKFSSLLFLPACALGICALRYVVRKYAPHAVRTEPNILRRRVGSLSVAALAAFLVVWAGYRFSLAPMTTAAERPHEGIDAVTGREGIIHDLANGMAETPIPLKTFIDGVRLQKEHNDAGHSAYLLGSYSHHGWWYFFPVVFAIKTPLAYAILVLVGAAALLPLMLRAGDWRLLAPVLCAAIIMLVVLPSGINIGSRYVLPIYLLLAPVAAFGTSYLWRLRTLPLVARSATVILIAWYLTSTAIAHPDYIGYFNELASSKPERFVADSDVDWGQDLYRLSMELKRRGISDLSLVYFGDEALTRMFDLPQFHELRPHERRSGWIAISIYKLKGLDQPRPYDGYAWLEEYAPVTTIGRSIKLYFIPEKNTNTPRP